MALHPEGIFTSGPLFHLVGLAAHDTDPIEWQVLRLRRVLRTEYWDAHWRAPMQPLASQLDHMAATFTDSGFAACPLYARQAWTAAAAPKTVPVFMTELAMLLRVADREQPPDHAEVPLARWEAEARFPLLRSLDTWAYDGEYDSFEAAFQARIDGEHPFCDEEVVPLLTQAVTALQLCARSEHFKEAFLSFDKSVTPATLKVIADLCHAHMRSHHHG
ncbi:hypothetical protein ABZ208_08585 [Streptomyces sp. NPDC006208]|uniref:hypothetical protein n=1 Tax=Streptomyces sp. NPDC006208 TaxID=3156734 RepID=UPI0033B7C6E9